MKKFLEKITALDFGKPAKRLFIIALMIALVGGALSAWMMRTQISELVALEQADEQQSAQAVESVPYHGEHDMEHDDGDREIDPFESGLISHPSVPAMGTFVGWIALCGLCALAYWLMVAAWLYKASARAGMNRALWTILGLAANVLAVAAFLIVRGRLFRCTKCGTWQKPSAYCRSCGSSMEHKCPKCGKSYVSPDAYCPDCGATLIAGSDDAEK